MPPHMRIIREIAAEVPAYYRRQEVDNRANKTHKSSCEGAKQVSESVGSAHVDHNTRYDGEESPPRLRALPLRLSR